MKHKKIISYVGLGALAFAFYFGFSTQASAFMGGSMTIEDRAVVQQTMFEEHAKILGISIDEIKNAWAQGQSFMELAKSKGFSQETIREKMKISGQEKMKAQLDYLVSKGIITQDQADKRLAFMKNKIEKMGDKAGEGKGKKAHNMMRGLGFGNL